MHIHTYIHILINFQIKMWSEHLYKFKYSKLLRVTSFSENTKMLNALAQIIQSIKRHTSHILTSLEAYWL